MTKSRWVMLAVVILVIAAIGVAIFVARPAPVGVLAEYPLDMLVEEAVTMNECAECHEGEEFHGCDTCHDDHGALEFEDVPFYAVISFEGDVPEPGYVLVNDVLPYRDQPHTHVPLLDFLNDQDVTEFESVTLASDDGGFVTVTRENLTAEAWLLPYEDGIRFAAEDLHVSAWIKGIRRMVVVGSETPLTVNGERTSMGRLLLGATRSVTVEETDVMLKSEEDDQIRRAQVGGRITGVPLDAMFAIPEGAVVTVVDASGAEFALSPEDARTALLAQLRGAVTLVLPEQARSQWIVDITELRSE